MSVVISHPHPPVINPPAFERRSSVLHLNRGIRLLFSAVPDDFSFGNCGLGVRNLNLVTSLQHSSLCALQLPAEPRLLHIDPQRIHLVFATQVCRHKLRTGLRTERTECSNSPSPGQHSRNPATRHHSSIFHSPPPRPLAPQQFALLSHIRSHFFRFRGQEHPA